MSGVVDPEPVPIQMDEGGTWRVGGTRVTLETIVAAFDRGDSAEEVHEQYPTVSLGDVYVVIMYYLRNPHSVQVYLEGRSVVGSEVRSVVAGGGGPHPRGGVPGPACSPGLLTIRFLADENFNRRILTGLSRRVVDLDVVRVQDVRLPGADDALVRQWAAEQDRVHVTHDVATVPKFALERISGRQTRSGVLVVPAVLVPRQATFESFVVDPELAVGVVAALHRGGIATVSNDRMPEVLELLER